MKDYLNAEERNQVMILMGVLQNINGLRAMNGTPRESMVEGWASRNNLTKDEQKSLKMITTYISKFINSILDRQAPKEKLEMEKRFIKFDFRLVDDLTVQKLNRDFRSRENAVVPIGQFHVWTENVMSCYCEGCEKHFSECDLYTVLENNFIPESTWNKVNCKFAYENQRKK